MDPEIEIISRDGSIKDGHIVLIEKAQNVRVRAALKSFGIFAVAALLGALIPVLHFILVPLLTLAAFFMAFNSYFDSHSIGSGQIICAKCGHTQIIEARAEIYPLVYDCEKCNSRMNGYRRSGSHDD